MKRTLFRATNNRNDRLPNATAYGGLTDFGKKVISEMNRLGMIADLSHTSYLTQLDTLEVSKAPVMFTHSAVYTLCNWPSFVRDDVLLKIVNYQKSTIHINTTVNNARCLTHGLKKKIPFYLMGRNSAKIEFIQWDKPEN
jgi:microsomal dipeptidase-like Zn-dependent dipeptidase